MHDIFLIDHGYPENRDKILKQLPTAKVVRAQDYWILLHRLADRVVTSRFWVLSTCVDYTDFDFNYEDRKSTRLNSSHMSESRMPSSA